MKSRHISKWVIVAAAVFALAAGAFSSRMVAHVQAQEPQSFLVQAGALTTQNIEVLAFAPQTLQVHRGDKITWSNNGFHTIHFESAPPDLIIAPEVDGKPLPQLNPAIGFPSIENGGIYSGGDANSGIPQAPTDRLFTLTIDLAPGIYSYFCDIHPGMVGILQVVDNGKAIPSPTDAAIAGATEFGAAVQAATVTGLQLEAENVPAMTVQLGSGNTGRATVNQYFPFVTTIKAGESVTFDNPQTSIEPHTVSWPPTRNQDVNPIPVEGGPPILGVGATLAPMTQSGASIKAGDPFSSGLIFPGQSFMLTFSEPGVYSFTCNIHPGMNGVIIVEPGA